MSPIRYARQRREQTALYLLVQRHADGFIAHAEAGTGAALWVRIGPSVACARMAKTPMPAPLKSV